MWIPEPKDLILQQSGGTSDMGSLVPGTDSDTNYVARFSLDVPYVFKWLRVHFSGSGTGVADMFIWLDSRHSDDHDTRLWEVPNRGIVTASGDADVFLWIGPEELCDWTFQPGDVIVLVWTNPDDGNLLWGAEAALAEVPTDATS